MSTWPVQDAKARFSEFLQACLTSGPQLVTKRGQDAAVLVPINQWRQLQAHKPPSLKEVLLDPSARGDFLTVPRGQAQSRPPEVF
ncbi:type II toxin-antitoxin system Phd/YefM family antitoxin [Rhodoferax sp.]|uniref:type II toxin-antitoxin system Phd/YefM family antitoxin n=1 Tax=Rhodoferax sp. TaxID=50421 RepID=UPI00260E2D3F|nr:type II toxin-antitoxin system Phd/YefM family antitoxin [Rhodoferax sp.]MDD2808480.1 type II toxin-antitoxin system Phd/YefM family antitoxin [Rhodoferax sp.]